MAAFPWIGGRLVDSTGSPAAAIWLAAATMMGCGLTFWTTRRAQRPPLLRRAA
jgi:predicted MFS family arabinose efflux permease